MSEIGVDLMALMISPRSILPTPSYIFRIQLPTKASHTTTSQAPKEISRASQEPMKLMSFTSFRSGMVSFTRALPFSSSAPTLTRPTVGFWIPQTSFI